MPEYTEDLNGKIQVQGELIPDGGAAFQPVIKMRYVKGGGVTFSSLTELTEFHPNLMDRGMSVRVVESDPLLNFAVREYVLFGDPTLDTGELAMIDPVTLLTKVNEDNFLNFWKLSVETFSNFNRIQEYAPDGANGARPVYPYTVPTETNWTPVYDTTKGHKWLRFRDDDVDDNADGIFDNWTVPIALGSSILAGDFIANAFARQNINATVATVQGELVVTNLVGGDSGWFIVTTGDIDHNDGTTTTNLTVGKYFKYISGDTYTFNNSADALQVLPAPPSVIAGLPNNTGAYAAGSGLESIIFTDDIPAPPNTLWEIIAQKSVYDALKSDWIIRLIAEDASLVRYATTFSASPDSEASTTEDAAAEPFNTNLENIGWYGSFQPNTVYLATRTDQGAPPWSVWSVQKVAGESGEFKDRVFRLVSINSDFDQLAAPVTSDPIEETPPWFDQPQQEDVDTINVVSEATKFFDGTLKTPWSLPVPYTGQDAFADLIVSDSGATFKYDQFGAFDPADMTLEARLYKGIDALWPSNNITYQWTRLYDDGSPDGTIADNDTGKVFYYLGAEGTPDDPAYKREAQRLFVTNLGVNGRAVFECIQTYTLADATTIVFIDEYVIVDLTDGKDAKDLSVAADNQLILYNVGGAEFSPTEIRLSAYVNNLPTNVLYWYLETSPDVWFKLTSGVGGYVFTTESYGAQMRIDVATVFTADGDLEEKRYAVSNINGDPTLNDNINTFTDLVTLVKTDSAATAVDGVDAAFGILDNESIITIIDDVTLLPVAGELGVSGKVKTTINVYGDGLRATQGAGEGQYSVVLASDNGNITPSQQVVSSDIEIYILVANWDAGERGAQITATITYNPIGGAPDIIFNKIFSVNSTLDTAGAIQAVIAATRYNFTPEDSSTITMTAELYNDKFTPALQDPANYWFSWKLPSAAFGAFVKGGGGTNGEIKTLDRANVRFATTVEVRIAEEAVPDIPNEILRTASISINDVLDGKTFHLYQTDADPYSQPAPPAATVDPAVGDGSWLPAPDPAIWAVDGTQRAYAVWGNPNVPEYDWSTVYQIGAEAGDQGNAGGGYFNMYSIYDSGGVRPTFPNGNTSSIDQMYAGVGQSAWLTKVPVNDVIWVTQRLYKGFTATSAGVKIQGVDAKLVGLDNSDAEPVSGSSWNTPTKLSGKDGGDGDGWTGGSYNAGDGKVTFTSDDGLGFATGDLRGASGLAPEHQWSGTQLRFKNPNGTWGGYVNLLGPTGATLIPVTPVYATRTTSDIDNATLVQRTLGTYDSETVNVNNTTNYARAVMVNVTFQAEKDNADGNQMLRTEIFFGPASPPVFLLKRTGYTFVTADNNMHRIIAYGIIPANTRYWYQLKLKTVTNDANLSPNAKKFRSSKAIIEMIMV